MHIHTNTLPWPISSKLTSLLEEEIRNSSITTANGVVIIFRDPKWTPQAGGYHTVEIAVSSDGKIQYVTDFGYFGAEPYIEIGKEIDWEFSPPGFFQHFGQEFPLMEGKELFLIWQSNFLHYFSMGVYTVTVASFTSGGEDGDE